LDDEDMLAAEEAALLSRAEALELMVRQHRAHRESARAARQRAEEQQAEEAQMQQWQAELRCEVEAAIGRINAERKQQIERCTTFEATLQANIDAMQAMQLQVRRRAAALDTSFDACIHRLSSAYVSAVAQRRQQAQPACDAAACDAAGAVSPPVPS